MSSSQDRLRRSRFRVLATTCLALLVALTALAFSGCGSSDSSSSTAASDTSSVTTAGTHPAAGKTPANLDGVTLNVIDSIGQSQLAAAGLAKTPYKVNYIKAPSSLEQGNAFKSGQIDLGLNSDIGFSTYLAQNLPITLVHAMQRPGNICAVLVPKDSSVHSVADLRGKTIANSVANGSEIVAYRAFQNAGLDLYKDAKIVNFDNAPDGAAAMLSGHADAWAGCGVAIAALLSQGKARTLLDGSQTANRWNAQNYWGVTNTSLANADKRAAILDYVGRVDRALVWGNTHPAELSKAQAKVFGAPEQATLAYDKFGPTTGIPVDASVIQGLQRTYELLVKLGRVKAGADIAGHFTQAYNDALR